MILVVNLPHVLLLNISAISSWIKQTEVFLNQPVWFHAEYVDEFIQHMYVNIYIYTYTWSNEVVQSFHG
jgi:hypothetical protein